MTSPPKTDNAAALNANLGSKDEPERYINIQIDRAHYRTEHAQLTGAELRSLPSPHIAIDRDLFQVEPGGPDVKISDGAIVQLHNGARFFTAPGQINPGAPLCQYNLGHLPN